MNSRAHGRILRALCAAAFAALLVGPAGAQGGRTPDMDPLAVTEDGLIFNSVLSVRLPQGPEWRIGAADVSSVIALGSDGQGEKLWAMVVWVPTEPEELQVGPKPDEAAGMDEVLRWGFRNVLLQQEVLDGGLAVRLGYFRNEGRTLTGLWVEPLPHYGEMGELCKRYRLLAADVGTGVFDDLPTDTLFFGKICMHPDLVAAVLLEYGRTFPSTGGVLPEIGPSAREFLDSLTFGGGTS